MGVHAIAVPFVAPKAFSFHYAKLSGWQWFLKHLGYLWSLSRTHLYLALLPVVIALVISLVLGVAASQVRWIYAPILAFTTVLYAVPSIAAFAFLVSVTGLSNWTVIIPLALYALAVLVRNVADGIANVPEEVRIAATAMGYRPLRRILTVELPSAVPVIIAGLRVATTSSISLVTVGALIGIGGFGQLFTDGEQTNFLGEIVIGILIVAFWALIFDLLLLASGRLLAPWDRRRAS